MPSSVIASMHYEAVQQELTIVYRGTRGHYRYSNVSPEEWKAFQSAKSKGTYLNEVFKQRRHPFERLPKD